MDLVLLPGMNCSPRLWRDVVGHLPDDVTPHAPHLEADTLEGCVESLLEVLPDRFALAGLSLGGIVAMALVRQAPERVTHLALLDTNPRPPTDDQRAGWLRTIDDVRGGASAEQVQRDLLPVLLAEGASDDVVASTLAMARETGERRLVDQLRLQGTRVDERPGLREVGVPTLVLGGELDALCPVERHEEIAALVPDARLVVVRGAGHLTPLEVPVVVAGHLRQLLA